MRLALTIAASLLVAPVAVLAQTAPAPAPAATPTVGTTVLDSQGATIGTIETVTPQAIVINTGTLKVPVPPTSVGKTAAGWSMAMTKAELEAAGQAAQAQAQAALKASLVPGAQVYGVNGTNVVGTIKSADAEFVTLTTPKGDVKLPIAGFGSSPNGIIIGFTAEQLDAAVSAAAPAPSN